MIKRIEEMIEKYVQIYKRVNSKYNRDPKLRIISYILSDLEELKKLAEKKKTDFGGHLDTHCNHEFIITGTGFTACKKCGVFK